MEALQYLKEKYEKEGNAIYFREPDLPMSTSLERICKYMQEYAESHTQAHTEGLREENERLKKLIFEIRRGMMVGISFGLPNTACQEYLDNINRIVGEPK